ncbi:uracil-DNA glycosylase [Streptomyces milbemycinicus]|uniref:uracil-DNA glycosylase n=1 Tax=Streptomyces milbemycinicus TaxID=476552 RepID=UPI003F4D2DDC
MNTTEDPEDPAHPAHQAPGADTLRELDERVSGCRACPRLVRWREEAGRIKRPAYREWDYWARPVPGFGPEGAALAIIGLAPAVHGGNRTGRMFTGDRAGDFLYAALHAVGLANQPEATHRGDGLELRGVRITAPVHCAPPANRPTTGERDTCRPWLVQELRLLRPTLRSVVVLGGFGWQAALPALAAAGWEVPRPRPSFAHGARTTLRAVGAEAPLRVFGCYHVSQQNTFTGRLTPAMLQDVLRSAAEAAGL